jgi:hypothetical protein
MFQLTLQLDTELNNIKKLQQDILLKDKLLEAADSEKAQLREENSQLQAVSLVQYPMITYYWTVPLFLDHSYLVGKLTSSKIADTKVSGI